MIICRIQVIVSEFLYEVHAVWRRRYPLASAKRRGKRRVATQPHLKIAASHIARLQKLDNAVVCPVIVRWWRKHYQVARKTNFHNLSLAIPKNTRRILPLSLA
jgi:hypothetical protein